MPKAEDYGVTSVIDVLQNVYKIEGEIRGDEYDTLCPNPKHPDNHPSTSVNLRTGYWNCFSCGKGGDLRALGVMVLGLSKDEVEDLLRPSTPEALVTSMLAAVARLKLPTRARHRALVLPGPYNDGPYDELLQRGFTIDTIQKFGVRYVPVQELQGKKGPFTIRDSFAFPIRDAQGRLLCWCYRRTEASPSWQPRYLYTPEVEVSELWGGADHHRRAKHIVVVEGYLDMMWCDQGGHPARALLGSKMGDRKILELQRYDSVTLLGDLDGGGASWVTRVGSLLGRRMPVRVAQYRRWMPDKHGRKERATDPEELLHVDLEIVLATAVPYVRWAMQRVG